MSKVKNTFKKLALLVSTNNNNNIEHLNDKKHEKLLITVKPLNINPLIKSCEVSKNTFKKLALILSSNNTNKTGNFH